MMQVLFVCRHNAGRSQMAAALFNTLARRHGLGAVGVSAGTEPGGEINPVAVQAMAELGISMERQTPRLLTPQLVAAADRVVMMGRGVDASACPAQPGVVEDWGLTDPMGKSIEGVRAVRDALLIRVTALVDELRQTAAC